MDNLTMLKERVAEHLRKLEGFPAAKILVAHPALQRELPLHRPVVAVGLEGVEVAPAGFGGYWGRRDGEDSLWGGGAAITLRLEVYCPRKEGMDCHGIYEAVCDGLMGHGLFGVQKVWCGRVEWDKTACANRLPVYATLSAALTHREAEPQADGFRVIRKNSEE